MNKQDFINVSKRMVKEYFNKYVAEKEGIKELSLSDIYVVGFNSVEGNYKILLSTPVSDGVYYKVTYNKEKDELKSSTVKTFDKRYVYKEHKVRR